MKTTIFTALLFAVIINVAFAQNQKPEQPKYTPEEKKKLTEELKKQPMNGFFGIAFANMVPQNDYFDNFSKSGQGFSVLGGYYYDPAPFAVGGQFDMIFNGSDEKRYKYERPGGWGWGEDTVQTQSTVIGLGAFFRMQPKIKDLAFPYLEAIAGMTMFSTSASYNPNSDFEDTKDRFNVAFHYGVGAGVMLQLADFITLPDSRVMMTLDVKLRYLFGTETDYYKVRINEDLSVDFDKFNTETDMVTTLIGLTFRF